LAREKKKDEADKVKQQLQLWGEIYDRSYIIQNVVFCPNCAKISHLRDWLG
jgi:hypothetical protein